MGRIINKISMGFHPIEVDDETIDELQCAIVDVLLARGFKPEGDIKADDC